MVFVTAISGVLLVYSNSVDPRAEQLQEKGSGSIELRGSDSGSIKDALAINDLLIASLKAVLPWRLKVVTPEGDLRDARGPAAIERARFRPSTGTVQVLLRDPVPLEVVVDWKTAQVLSVSPRHGQRWATLHSGAVVGEGGTFLLDALAAVIILMALTGIWIWYRDRDRADLDRTGRWHRSAGLVVGLVLLVPAVTGVLMNHRADLGWTYRPQRELEGEQMVRLTPAPLSVLAAAAATAIARNEPGATVPGVDWLDYFPRHGLVTVGFVDGTDVFVDAYSGEERAVVRPRHTWVRRLHSGRILGASGGIVTTFIGVAWMVVTWSGLYLMVGSRRRMAGIAAAPLVRNQLAATTLLLLSAALFANAALQLNRLADGWTTRGIWTAALALAALAAAVGPWLWAQTVRSQRVLLAAILIGSGGGLLALLPGVSYLVVGAAQAALLAAVIAETPR